jgi:hypothetical protein
MRSWRFFKCVLSMVFVVSEWVAGNIAPAHAQADEVLTLNARTRTRVELDTDRWHSIETPLKWVPKETCIVVCDMWDDHWCKQSAARVGEMAPRR